MDEDTFGYLRSLLQQRTKNLLRCQYNMPGLSKDTAERGMYRQGEGAFVDGLIVQMLFLPICN